MCEFDLDNLSLKIGRNEYGDYCHSNIVDSLGYGIEGVKNLFRRRGSSVTQRDKTM